MYRDESKFMSHEDTNHPELGWKQQAQKSSSEDDFGPTRRQVLGTIGLSAAGITVAAGRSGARANEPDIYTLSGTKSDPVTADEIQNAQHRAMESYRAENPETSLVTSVPEPQSTPIVEFRFMIDDAGRTHQFSWATDQRTPDAAAAAAEAERRFQKAHQESLAQQTSGSNPDWTFVHNSSNTNCEKPYGCVTNDTSLWRLDNDSKSDEDAFGVTGYYEAVPGTSKYNSSWKYSVGDSTHDWTAGDFTPDYLLDRTPDSDQEGSKTVNCSLTAEEDTFSWSFDIDREDVLDRSDPSEAIGYWVLDKHPKTYEDTRSMLPGSAAWLPQKSSGSYHLMDLGMMAYWHDGYGESDKTGWQWHIYHSY